MTLILEQRDSGNEALWSRGITMTLRDVADPAFVLERVLEPGNEVDRIDLRVAGTYERYREVADARSEEDAALVYWCMAVERIFPAASPRLPA